MHSVETAHTFCFAFIIRSFSVSFLRHPSYRPCEVIKTSLYDDLLDAKRYEGDNDDEGVEKIEGTATKWALV